MLEAYALYAALLLFPALLTPPKKRRTLSGFLSALSLRPKPIRTTLALTVLGFSGLLLASALAVSVSGLFGFSDAQAVAEKVAVLGPFGLLLVVSLGPLAEEVFFRGFLQPRLGVLPTSALFGVLHYAFDSVAVMVAAFLSALALGYLFRKSGNLWACVLAHAAFNAFNLALVLFPLCNFSNMCKSF